MYAGDQTPDTMRPARPPRPVRRTQAERSLETRAKLLDAAERALVERGYAGTTTPDVCRRAGITNGSLLHHFGTRERLLAATLDRLCERRRREVLGILEAILQSDDRVRALVESLWSVFASDDFKVILELWLAASNEEGLRRRVLPILRGFDEMLRPMAARLFPKAARRPKDLAAAVGLLFHFMQGMGLAHAAFRPAPGAEADDAAERALLVKVLSPLLAG